MQFGVKVIFVVLATLSASQGLAFIDSSMTEYEEPLLERNKRTLTTICVEIKPSSPYEEPYFMCKGTDSQFSKGSSESHSSYPSKPSYKPKPSASYGSGESESYHSGVKNDYHTHTKPEYQTDHSKYDKPPAYDSSQDYSAPSKPTYDKKPLYSGHGGQSEYQQYESSKPSSSYPAHKDDYAKPAVHKVTYEKPSVHYEPAHSSKPQTYNHDSSAHGYTESTKYIKPSAYDHQSESGAYSKPSGYDDHRESTGYFKPSSYDQSSSNPSSYNEGSQSKPTYGHAGPSYSAPSHSTHLKPSNGHGSPSYVAPHETKALYAKPKPSTPYGHNDHSSYGQSSPSYGEHYSEKPYSKPSPDHQEGYSKPTYSSVEKNPAKTYTAPQKDYKQYATVSGYAPAEHHSATSGYATPPHSSVPSYVPQSHSTVSDYAPQSQDYRVMSPDVMQWQDPQLVQDGHFGYRTMGAPMEYQNFDTPRMMNQEEQLQQQYTGLEGPMRFDLSGNQQDSPILQAPYPSQLYSSAQYGYTAPPSPIYSAPPYPAPVSSYAQVPAPSYVPVNYEKVSPSYSPAAPTYLPTPSCPQNFMYSFQPLILPMPCYSSSATYSPPAYSHQLGAPASGAQERSQQNINPLQEPSLVRSESDSEKPKTTDEKNQESQETNKKPEVKVETSDPKKMEPMKKPEVVDEKPVENKSQDRTVGAENPREEKAKVTSSSKSLEGPDTKAAHDALMRMSKIAATLEKNEPIPGADAGSNGQVNEKPPSTTQLFSRPK